MTWEGVRLGDLAHFIRGVTFKPDAKVELGSKGSVVCFRTSNVQRYLDQDDLISVPKSVVKRIEQFVRTADILVSSANSWNLVGKACWIPKLTYEATLGGFISALRVHSPRLDPRYLFHWFTSPEVQNSVRSFGRQTTNISNLDFQRTLNLEIPLPPLSTQQRIAAVLDEVDALRQKRERSMDSLEALRESTYVLHLSENQASSTRVRVSELIDPHRGGMRTGPFGSQLLHSEFVDDPDGIMVLGIDNAVKNRFRYTGDRYITPEKYEGLRRYTVHPGDVLVTIMGTCGRVAIVPSDIPTAINTKHLCAMTLNERCLPEYLHATLTYNHSVLKQMGASARGAIMDGLNMGIISGLQFELPDISKQRELQQVFAEIDSLTNKALHAREIEDTLLSSIQTRAFSGELALRDLEALL